MAFETNLILIGSIFILTIISGVILSRLGKPYNKAMFNLHKLIALAVLVYVVILSIKLIKGIESDQIMIVLLPVIILLSVSAFATGALMSINRESKTIVLRIHNTASALIFLAIASILIITCFFKN